MSTDCICTQPRELVQTHLSTRDDSCLKESHLRAVMIIGKETALVIILFYRASLAQDDVALANDYVDRVLEKMRSDRDLLAAIDPLQVPDVGENSFQITGGQVLGLSAFYRSGNSTVQLSHDTAIVTTPAAVNDVFFTGRHRASRFGLTISGDIEASLNRVYTIIVYRAPIKGGEARLEYFQANKEITGEGRTHPQVDNMEGLKVTRITGVSSAFNWLLKIVANRVARHFQGRIEAALQDEVSKFIATQLDRSRFPALSGNGSRVSTESFAYPGAPF
ncbi:uncharacterized protein LOC119431019 [Dermacentor silvarum]|uniref:uncharacterized protein LOC119431019 n=1 Tax=Dermacentor silvarum TaxID=543639 RepID=UPI0021017EAE|nr:uncharacterized protein LOC119431019 [Dermacentor silvarum]